MKNEITINYGIVFFQTIRNSDYPDLQPPMLHLKLIINLIQFMTLLRSFEIIIMASMDYISVRLGWNQFIFYWFGCSGVLILILIYDR